MTKKSKLIPEDAEKFEINCENYSDKQLKEFLREIPSAKIKELSVFNSDRVLKNNCCAIFWKDYSNFTMNVIKAIKQNNNLETLILGDEFSWNFPHENKYQHINFQWLLNCSNLKTLVIESGWWEEKVYSTLLSYLTDPRCRLENLELDCILTDVQKTELIEALKQAPSLKNYEGDDQEKIQEILNKKNFEVPLPNCL